MEWTPPPDGIRFRSAVGQDVEQLARIGCVYVTTGFGQPADDFVLQRAVRRAEGIPIIACPLNFL